MGIGILNEDDKIEILKLFFRKNSNYEISGNLKKELIKEIRVVEKIIREIYKGKEIDRKIENLFYEYCKKENFDITKEFLCQIEKRLGYRINEVEYYKIYAYILILLNFDEISRNKEMLIRKFMAHTTEYLMTEEVLRKIFKEKGISRELKESTLIQITDVIMGITLNNFENECFECWVDEDCIVDKIVDKISNEIKTDLRKDKILHNGILHHIKLAIYRIKNDIHIINSVYKELFLINDEIIGIVRSGVKETEDIFGIKFTEYELSCIGFQVKSAIKRYDRNNMKKVVLICGLGYGSSKVLEQNLKENYDLDIIDVLPYYLADDIIHNYRRVDLVLSTIELNKKYHIPVVKINPVLKREDFQVLEQFGIKRSNNKILMSELLDVIEENSQLKNKSELVYSLKRKFNNKIIDDYTKAGKNLKKYISRSNVKFVDKLEDWKNGIEQVGNILVKNGFAKNEYTEELKSLVEKYGPYIIIEEGFAMPHGGISDKVIKTGVGLLIVKEKVKFPEGKTANIFFSFATKNRNDRPEILNDLFELITKHNFIEKLSKMKRYEELEKYFENL